MNLVGLVGTENYEYEEFESGIAYQFSLHNQNVADGLYDPLPLSNASSIFNADIDFSDSLIIDPSDLVEPGETLEQAFYTGNFDGSTSLQFIEGVGEEDYVDLYAFSTTERNTFNFTLEGLSADVDLELVDEDGDVIIVSDNSRNYSEYLVADLPAGDYYLGVASYDGELTSYRLSAHTGINAAPLEIFNTLVDPRLTTEIVL